MKKRIFTMIVVAVVLLISVFSLCACGGGVTGEVEIKSFKAEEAIDWFAVRVFDEKEGGTTHWEYEKNPFEAIALTNGTDFLRTRSWDFYLKKTELSGYEFAVLQFDIVADRDVEGQILLHYYGEAGDYSMDCKKDFVYALKANVKQTLTIVFDENFIVSRSHEDVMLNMTFLSGKQRDSIADVAWTQAQYSISNWELGVNENK